MLRLILQCVTSASDMMTISKHGKEIRIKCDDVGIIRSDGLWRDWNAYAKGVLRSEMTRRQISYADLVKLFAEDGVKETEANLRNKVSRGSFTAAFLFPVPRGDEGYDPPYRR